MEFLIFYFLILIVRKDKIENPNLYNNRIKKIKIFATLSGYGKYY